MFFEDPPTTEIDTYSTLLPYTTLCRSMRAADAGLITSGTATLECLLLGRPMVVAYRGAALTAWLLLSAGMLKTPHVSLPNLLSDEAVVPELLHQQATPEALAATLLPLLETAVARDRNGVVQGKIVSERVDLSGGRSIKKKK